MSHTQNHKPRSIRYKEATQWIHATITCMILGLIYVFQANISSGNIPEPNTPPITEQEYVQELFAPSQDAVILQNQDAVILQNQDATILFYSGTSIDDIPYIPSTQRPVSYSQVQNGIMVVEGNLSSPLVDQAVAMLDSK